MLSNILRLSPHFLCAFIACEKLHVGAIPMDSGDRFPSRRVSNNRRKASNRPSAAEGTPASVATVTISPIGAEARDRVGEVDVVHSRRSGGEGFTAIPCATQNNT